MSDLQSRLEDYRSSRDDITELLHEWMAQNRNPYACMQALITRALDVLSQMEEPSKGFKELARFSIDYFKGRLRG